MILDGTLIRTGRLAADRIWQLPRLLRARQWRYGKHDEGRPPFRRRPWPSVLGANRVALSRPAKSVAARSKTGESSPSLESRTWYPVQMLRASTHWSFPLLLLRVLFRQDWRHSTQLSFAESLLRVLFRQPV